MPLRLALVGMSGAGKTFWTKKLAAEGWTAICCDDPHRGEAGFTAGGWRVFGDQWRSGVDGLAR